jgi:hypothetical protein
VWRQRLLVSKKTLVSRKIRHFLAQTRFVPEDSAAGHAVDIQRKMLLHGIKV